MGLLENKSQLIRLIDEVLRRLLLETSRLPKMESEFDCMEIPRITIRDYLKRISRYAKCSLSAYVVALVYIDRFQQRTQGFVLNSMNVHRLLITCIMLAIKVMDDLYFTNKFYAKLGGITNKQINKMEVVLLTTFDYSLHISHYEFEEYLDKLEHFQLSLIE